MFHEFDAIIEEMRLVYKHDQRPWMLGYSGGKDSTLLCQLVFEMLLTLAPEERTKKVYVVTSDTMVENPIVKEDKSLQNFIEHGATELIPLRRFRNWLVELRATPEARDWRRRNGSVYFNSEGEFGRGPFTLETRKTILKRLLQLEDETGYELITMDELKMIDKLWEDEGDLSRRALVDTYYEVRHHTFMDLEQRHYQRSFLRHQKRSAAGRRRVLEFPELSAPFDPARAP